MATRPCHVELTTCHEKEPECSSPLRMDGPCIADTQVVFARY